MKKHMKKASLLAVTLLASSLLLSGCMDLYDEDEVATVYTVTFDGNGGSLEDGSTTYTQSFSYGVEQKLLKNRFTRSEYDFDGWANVQGEDIKASLGDEQLFSTSANVTLYAVWNSQGDTPYKVNHYKQELTAADGSYNIGSDYSLADTDDLKGTVGKLTAATSKSFDGFESGFTVSATETGAVADTVDGKKVIQNRTIEVDSSGNPVTVINVFYNRKIYAVTYDACVDESEKSDGEVITVPSAASARFGQIVLVNFEASRTGYDFKQWEWQETDETKNVYALNGTVSITMKAADVVLKAVWTPKTDTVYNVLHYRQALEGNEWMQPEIVPCRGETATVVVGELKDYTGFTPTQTETTAEIASDGSTEIRIYYTRNIHTVTYVDGVTTAVIPVPVDATKYRYGATVPVSFTNSEGTDMTTVGLRPGFTFMGWTCDPDSASAEYASGGTESFVMDDADVILYAVWQENAISGGNISVTPPEYSDKDLALKASSNSGNEVVFTVASGYESYTWFVDGQPVTFTAGAEDLDAGTVSYTWDCSASEANTYCIMLRVTEAGSTAIYSATTNVTLIK